LGEKEVLRIGAGSKPPCIGMIENMIRDNSSEESEIENAPHRWLEQ
jgi:hypothetical protein